MELLMSANYSGHFTKIDESATYKSDSLSFKKSLLMHKNESYDYPDSIKLGNTTNSSDLNWVDYGHINTSLILDNFTDKIQENLTEVLISLPASELQQMITRVLVSSFLGLLILATIVGNIFVIVAILLEKNLQTVGNYLVFSLAVADLLVALLVMPLGAINEVYQEWILGPGLCEFWTSGDVLCCTASILHLVAIALDRYWAVTNVDYVRQRSSRRITVMIILVWTVGCLVSFAPILGWKDADFLDRIQKEKRCMVSQDALYQIFATCSSFYAPLIIILILYWRIFQVARKRIRHKPGAKACVQPTETPMAQMVAHAHDNTVSQITEFTNSATNGNTTLSTDPIPTPKEKKKPTRENMEAKRERKAAKTLVIITGAFVMCWLPFFVTALLMAVCPACQPNGYLFSFFLWLGYANSMLNPIIYTIFSPDFRCAFKRILCGRRRYYVR